METLESLLFDTPLLPISLENSCFCKETLFDGSCIAKNGTIIAKCMNIFNKTHADCTWAMKGSSEFYNQPVECCIDDTCENRGKQLVRSSTS